MIESQQIWILNKGRPQIHRTKTNATLIALQAHWRRVTGSHKHRVQCYEIAGFLYVEKYRTPKIPCRSFRLSGYWTNFPDLIDDLPFAVPFRISLCNDYQTATALQGISVTSPVGRLPDGGRAGLLAYLKRSDAGRCTTRGRSSSIPALGSEGPIDDRTWERNG